MKRLVLAILLGALWLPGSALAARSNGVVFSVTGGNHTIEVIGPSHAVRAYHYAGHVPALAPGRRISFQHAGSKITGLKRTSRTTRLTFLGTVVRAGPGGVVVRLSDGDTMTVHPTRVLGTGGDSLGKGSIVLVTETLGHRAQVTIKVPRQAPAAGRASGGQSQPDERDAIGAVVEVDPSSFVLQTSSDSQARFQITPDQLYQAQMSLCNIVSVSYTAGNPNVTSDDLSFADNDATTGICKDPGVPQVNGIHDVVGPITKLTLSAVTVSSSNRPVTLAATIDLTSGFLVGDTVDVTYAQATNGSLVATDVESDDFDAVGTVTAVSAGSVTLVDRSGATRTFADDPNNGTFQGIALGDQIDVAYYYSSGHVVVDYVSDLTKPMARVVRGATRQGEASPSRPRRSPPR